jgi:hypothetical protein
VLIACTDSEADPAVVGTAESGPEISLFVPLPSPSPGITPTPTPRPPASGPQISFQGADEQYLLFNQRIIEGLSAQDLDVHNTEEVFKYIFSRLPDEVTVYPSENYFYFVLYADGGQWWGNIRLPARSRADGDLSFAYFNFEDFPIGARSRDAHTKVFNAPDGVFVRERSRFVWEVEFEGKIVAFNFHELRQDRPRLFALDQREVFIQRTFDESGLQFFLLFDRDHNHFLWVLNQEELVPESLLDIEGNPDFVIGAKSGFVFWIDREHGSRNVLAAIRRASVQRNDYYDGPFDQLADNYALETNVSEYMQRAYPNARDNVDVFGYYLDQERALRVGISPYYTYADEDDLHAYLTLFESSTDQLDFLSHGADLAATGGASERLASQTSTPVQ